MHIELYRSQFWLHEAKNYATGKTNFPHPILGGLLLEVLFIILLIFRTDFILKWQKQFEKPSSGDYHNKARVIFYRFGFHVSPALKPIAKTFCWISLERMCLSALSPQHHVRPFYIKDAMSIIISLNGGTWNSARVRTLTLLWNQPQALIATLRTKPRLICKLKPGTTDS